MIMRCVHTHSMIRAVRIVLDLIVFLMAIVIKNLIVKRRVML